VVSQAGTVIDGLDINGDVQINASNVTLKNSRVHSNGWVGIRIKDGVSGVVIQDVEVNGSGAAGTSNSNGIWGPATTYRANVYGYENPFVPGSGSVIQDSYVHDLGAPAGPHYDGVQIDGGVSNITIRHNTIINNNETVSAIMIDNYFGSIANITVDNNYLAGGGFTVYSDDSFNLNPISGVKFTNNRMGKGTWGYGYIGIAKPLDTGNVDATTGVTIRLG
jgi:hypothetical protein